MSKRNNLNLNDLSAVQIIDGKPFIFHRNGFVIDGKTMRKCGHKTKDGYVRFGSDSRQKLHRWMLRVFTDWNKTKTPNGFPGGHKAWKELKSKERMEFFWEWGAGHHINGTAKGNGIDNLAFISSKHNSQIGNKFNETDTVQV